MQEIECPACSQKQIAGQKFCSFCYARFDVSSEASDFAPLLSSSQTLSNKPEIVSLPSSLGLFFEHPIKAPLLWVGGSLLSLLLISSSHWGLIQASSPRWLVFASLLVGFVLVGFFYQKYYPLIARASGGYSPPVQRILLGIASFTAFLAGFMLCAWKLFWLGVPLILVGLAAMVASSGGMMFRRRKGLLQSFSELVHSRERLDFKGVVWAERLSLILILSGFIFALSMTVDMLIPIGKPNHQIKILGKEEHHGGRGGSVYTLKIAGWKTPQNRIDIKCSRIECKRVDVGGTYRMQTRRGIFGGERILHIKPDLDAMHNGS